MQVLEKSEVVGSRVKALEEIRGTWIEGFLAEKRRGTTRRGVVCKEDTTIPAYAYLLNRVRKTGLDLRSCSLVDLNAYLDGYRVAHELTTYINVVGAIKDAIVYLKRKDLNEQIRIPKRPDAAQRIKDDLIPEEDVMKLIKEAPTPRDRLIIELFYELGGRRGEIGCLRVRDVQFDQYSAILTLTGKSGTRRRRVYQATPDLRTHLNNHPHRDDPNSPLFFTEAGKAFRGPSIYQLVRRLSTRILGHELHPHQFRHTRATADSALFTDRELMKLYGWKRPDMIAVYSHLSMRDVDQKDLVLHGMKAKEETLRPMVQVQRCGSCSEENAPIAIYCVKCGELLPNARPEELKKLTEKNQHLTERIKRLEGLWEKAFEKKITDTA